MRLNKKGTEAITTLIIIILLVLFMFVVIPGIWDFKNTLSSFKQFVGITAPEKIEIVPTSDYTELGCDGLIKYMDQQMDSDKRIQVYEQYLSQKCSADSLSGFVLLETGKAYRNIMGNLPDIYEKANSLITSGNDKLHNEESEYYLALIKREHDLIYQDKIIAGTKTPEFNNAQKLFENFKTKYPKSTYVSEATFYLGEMEIKFGITNEGQGGNTQTPIKKEFYLLKREFTLIDFNCNGNLETQQFRCSNMDSAIKLLEDYLKYDSSIFLVKNEEEARKYLSLMKGDLNYLESEYAKTKSRTDLGKILFMYSQKLHPNKVTDGNIVYNKFLNFLTDNLITHTTITESNSNYNPHLTATTLAESHYRAYLYYTKINNKENADKALNEAMSIANSYGIEDFKTKLSTLTYNSLIYPDSPEELRNPSFLKYLNAKWPSPPAPIVEPEKQLSLYESAKKNYNEVQEMLNEILDDGKIDDIERSLYANDINTKITEAIAKCDAAIKENIISPEQKLELYGDMAQMYEQKNQLTLNADEKRQLTINALEKYAFAYNNFKEYSTSTNYKRIIKPYSTLMSQLVIQIRTDLNEAITLFNKFDVAIKEAGKDDIKIDNAKLIQDSARSMLAKDDEDLKFSISPESTTLKKEMAQIASARLDCEIWLPGGANWIPTRTYSSTEATNAINRCNNAYDTLTGKCKHIGGNSVLGIDMYIGQCIPA